MCTIQSTTCLLNTEGSGSYNETGQWRGLPSGQCTLHKSPKQALTQSYSDSNS